MVYEFGPSLPYELIPLRHVKLVNFSVGYVDEFKALPAQGCGCLQGCSFMISSCDENGNECPDEIRGHLSVAASPNVNSEPKQLLNGRFILFTQERALLHKSGPQR